MPIEIIHGYSGEELIAEKEGDGQQWNRYAGISSFGEVRFGAAPARLNGFGEIVMTHGYGRGGYGDYMADPWNVETDPDTIAKAQLLGIPDGTNLSGDTAAMFALMNNVPYAQAQGIDPGIASNLNNWIQTAAIFSTQLATAYASASSSQQAALQAAYTNTQNNLSNFQSIGQELMTDTGNQAKISSWIGVGQAIIATANSIANALPQSAISVAELFKGFPQSLADVLAWSGKQVVAAVNFLMDQAGNVTKKASWSVAEILLVVGGSALVLLWGARKAGLKINLPFVSLDGYSGKRKRGRSRGRGRSKR